MKLKFDGFILALLFFIVLAYFFPQLHRWENGEVLNWITSIGVSLIFFFYGLKLSFKQIKEGLSNWKLHVFVQLATFLLFPLLVLPFYPLVSNAIQHDFWLSFFFLAALPSTVSSSVVMVSIARGNVPAAIFNASISGLIGVLITPLWMQLFVDFGQIDVLGDVYWGLVKEILIPVILGLLLQPVFGKWASRYGKQLSLFDRSIILMIVYGSFAESFDSGVFGTVSIPYMIMVLVVVVILFVLIYALIYWLSKSVLKLNRADTITALFCGSKKSLTHGSVFGKFLFVNSSSAGLYFLPLMVFHAFQILVVTIIAQRYNTRFEENK
ncbi:bile acid:sodium symporter family protein [Sphingobacterium paludis]|uniref:Sodium/bile acid cotransporter 7 n=1 Tax=Sphingobacterium paludis TaxID=1476465 RepID=A0A4R7DAB4_9SPHI|nr:bile acid:sodium symporter family protein [Sphingobacterium paludis]TDS17332.1 sodium/bile acid cotransporter 7 [Sphingobacterium paludis]